MAGATDEQRSQVAAARDGAASVAAREAELRPLVEAAGVAVAAESALVEADARWPSSRVS